MGTCRVYIDGMYMSAASTRRLALEGAKQMLPIFKRIKAKEAQLRKRRL
jgi:hypothetical protein